MEILSESPLWGEFIGIIAFCSISAAVFGIAFIGIIVVCIKEGFEFSDIVGVVVTGLITAGIITLIAVVFNDGPTVHYKAIVTDYNEVYDAGYTVVSTEGKIVTLTKEDE